MSESVINSFEVNGTKEIDIRSFSTNIDLLYYGKADYKDQLKKLTKELDELQEKMYAHKGYGALVIFQALDAFETAINKTASENSPWYVILADDKYNMRLLTAKILCNRLSNLDIHFSKSSEERQKELKKFNEIIEEQDKSKSRFLSVSY
jgi:polyphosphate kinase 2 (PPK2 family)